MCAGADARTHPYKLTHSTLLLTVSGNIHSYSLTWHQKVCWFTWIRKTHTHCTVVGWCDVHVLALVKSTIATFSCFSSIIYHFKQRSMHTHTHAHAQWKGSKWKALNLKPKPVFWKFLYNFATTNTKIFLRFIYKKRVLFDVFSHTLSLTLIPPPPHLSLSLSEIHIYPSSTVPYVAVFLWCVEMARILIAFFSRIFIILTCMRLIANEYSDITCPHTFQYCSNGKGNVMWCWWLFFG